MHIQRYNPGSEMDLWQVFHAAIRRSCRGEYTEAQLRAWAPDDIDDARWTSRIRGINPFVAIVDGDIAGYADVQADGYIDHFFMHPDYQRQGIGTALMARLQAEAQGLDRLYSHVSDTARPFFECHGFLVAKRQLLEINGQTLANQVMERSLL